MDTPNRLEDAEIADRPLSPVLSGNVKSRQFFKRQKSRSSRVKLSDRFSNNTAAENVLNNTTDFLEDSFSLSQNITLLEKIERLEEIEKNRQVVCKILTSCSSKIEPKFCFKIPTSPAPNKRNRSINSPKHEKIEKQDLPQETTDFLKENILPDNIPKIVNFKTCSGKEFVINNNKMQTHAKLFDDILNPTQNNVVEHDKKFSFLSKTNVKKSVSLEEDDDMFEPEEKDKTNHFLTFQLPENINGEICSKNFDNSSNNKIKKENSFEDFSFTQQIFDSGISNTQINSAIESIIDNFENNSKCVASFDSNQEFGFSNNEIIESIKKIKHFFKVLKDNASYDLLNLSNLSIELEKLREKSNKMENSEETIFPGCSIVSSVSEKSFTPTRKCDSSSNVKDETSYSPKFSNASRIQNKGFKTPLRRFSSFSSNEDCSSSAKKRRLGINSCKQIEIAENKLNLAKQIFENMEKPSNESSNRSFNKTTTIPPINEVLSKATNIFGDEDFSDLFPKNLPGFSTPNGPNKTIPSMAQVMEKAKNIFGVEDISGFRDKSYSSPVNSFRPVSENVFVKAKNIFGDEDLSDLMPNNNSPLVGFKTCSNKNITPVIKTSTPLSTRVSRVPEISLKNATNLFGDEDFSDLLPNKNFPAVGFKTSSNNFISSIDKPAVPTRSFSDPSLKRKTSFSEEFNHNCGPKRFRQIFNSTPNRKSFEPIEKSNELSTIKAIDSTNSFSTFESNVTVINKGLLAFQEPSSYKNIARNLEIEKENLEKAMEIVKMKQQLLVEYERRSCDKKRPVAGILLSQKQSNAKINLRIFVNDKFPGTDPCYNSKLFEITPQNAENVHFYSENLFTSKEGAILLPNSSNFIGLGEIELAFPAMDGVEKRLIPKGWIRNHFRWIVLKLASYERMFPNHFAGCLNLENVLQQLKYRYDREIDKAERSGLRKIFERDDSSQKRIILCVSDILEKNGKFELELTDGWYKIKTVIDEPLSYQIFKKKIQIGTKLITCGAEILNCEGCHPLDATDLISLKINYNNTRRAIWHAKLGFQPICRPIPIQISSVHVSGGMIGCVEVYVARIYPERIMERQDGVTIWRNKKADDRCAQLHETERHKKIEEIQENARKEYESEKRKAELSRSKVKYYKNDICDVTCPKSLYEIYKNSTDPESILDYLNPHQRKSLFEYQDNIMRNIQQEMMKTVQEAVNKLGVSKRNVTRTLTLKVMDVNSDGEQYFNFTIWRYNEGMFLKEGSFLSIFNVMPSKSGDLNSSNRTKFEEKDDFKDSKELKFRIYERRFISISELTLKSELTFNEFDTIGIVVQTKMEEEVQSLWLSDENEDLLLVKIFEKSQNCILLEGIKRGQVITACNLYNYGLNIGFSKARGNYFSVFSRFSQFKHLQAALATFEQKIPENLDILLENCDKRIEKFDMDLNKSDTKLIREHSSEEMTSLCYTKVTSTDMAMSSLDMENIN